MAGVAANSRGATYTVTPSHAHNWALCGGYFAACKQPAAKRKVSYQVQLGITVHDLIARHDRNDAATQDLEHFIARNWRPGQFAAEEDEFARQEASDMLDCYRRVRQGEEIKIIESEWFARVERRSIGDGLYISLSGRIDRLGRRSDGDIEVLDFKTAAALPSEAELREDLASTAYHVLAAERSAGERIVISQWSLRSNVRSEVALSPAELAAGKARLCDMVREMARGEFRRSRCEACAYCPARSDCSVIGPQAPIDNERAKKWLDP